MMWHLVSDSACDLNTLKGTEGKIDFATIPFTIRIGGKEYIDDAINALTEFQERFFEHIVIR